VVRIHRLLHQVAQRAAAATGHSHSRGRGIAFAVERLEKNTRLCAARRVDIPSFRRLRMRRIPR
jgi:hypothetical protein